MTIVDYLEADPEISDQRFALVSMVLPESIVEKREVFYVTEFLMKKLVSTCEPKYVCWNLFPLR